MNDIKKGRISRKERRRDIKVEEGILRKEGRKEGRILRKGERKDFK
jgi:hypothetical protein